MSEENDLLDSHDNASLSAMMLGNLKQTAPWKKFIGIIFMILGGLGAIFGLVAVFASPLAGLISLILYGVYFYLGLLLFQIGSGFSSASSNDLESAFAKQKTFWMIFGILMIISIVFVIVALVAGGSMMGSVNPSAFR